MTVISAMLFNPNEGAIVSDEQTSSGTGRKWDIATKIREVTSPTINAAVGGSGISNIIYETICTAHDCAKNNKDINSPKTMAELLAKTVLAIRNSRVNTILQGNYGISEYEFITGKIRGEHSIDRELMQRYLAFQSSDTYINILGTSFIALMCTQSNDMSMYHIDCQSGAITISQPFAAIGSGSDMPVAKYRILSILIPYDKPIIRCNSRM